MSANIDELEAVAEVTVTLPAGEAIGRWNKE